MDIIFKNTKLTKIFSNYAKLQRTYGPQQAKKIAIRMKELRAADCLQDLWGINSASRCHELIGGLKGYFSVDLRHPYRLLFTPNHNPIPTKQDGGIHWAAITAIIITGVEDTHE